MSLVTALHILITFFTILITIFAVILHLANFPRSKLKELDWCAQKALRNDHYQFINQLRGSQAHSAPLLTNSSECYKNTMNKQPDCDCSTFVKDLGELLYPLQRYHRRAVSSHPSPARFSDLTLSGAFCISVPP